MNKKMLLISFDDFLGLISIELLSKIQSASLALTSESPIKLSNLGSSDMEKLRQLVSGSKDYRGLLLPWSWKDETTEYIECHLDLIDGENAVVLTLV